MVHKTIKKGQVPLNKTIKLYDVRKKTPPQPKRIDLPMLSVLITAHNTENYIQKCISSIITQKWRGEIEILVCDDGSTDNTYRKIPAGLPNLYIVRNEMNLGISKSLNQLFEMARGEYLFFIGSDDYLTGNYFEYAFEQIQKGYDVIYTNMQIENEEGKPFGVGTLYLPIFHRKYLVKWDWPKDEAGHDIPQKRALIGVPHCCNPSADYHYVRRKKNHTTIYGQYRPEKGEFVPKNEPMWRRKKSNEE